MQLGNSKWENAVFNSRLQPTQLGLGTSATDQSLWKVNYDYGTTDNNGNVKIQQINVPGQFTASQFYDYDSLNRLKSAQETTGGNQTWRQVFAYDRYGNRNFDTTYTTTLGSCSAAQCNPTVDTANNRFSSGQGYTYDASGNVTADAQGRTFVYDAENKQKEVKDSSNNSIGQYLYDGDGKRVKKISSTEITVFVYDGGGKLAAEYLMTSSTPNTPTTSYLTTDSLGSPRVITDQSGNIQSRRDFMPFGEEISGLGGRSQAIGYQTSSVRQMFTGYEKDTESSLDFSEARFYNSNHGRFTSIDPLLTSIKPENPQTLNRYIYVLNMPLVMIDPTGEMGDYYDKNGRWVGTDGIDDDKAYLLTPIGRENGQVLYSRQDLGITHTQFQIVSNIVRQEGETNDGEEYLWIAHASNNQARAINRTLFALLMSNYSSVDDKDKTELATNNSSFAANASRASIIHVLLGGSDPTGGARFWDGTDFLAWGLNSPNGTPHNKFEEYSEIRIDSHVFYWYLMAQQSRWGSTVRYGNNRYNLPADVFRDSANWVMYGTYMIDFQYNTGVKGRRTLTATGTRGRSIFWRVD